MDISVIISAYNRSDLIARLLESMGNLAIPDGLTWEILIIDNASSDNTGQIVRAKAAENKLPIKYIFDPVKNKSMVLNNGIKTALGNVLVFLDSDMAPDKDYLQAVMAAVRRYPDINIFGGRVLINWPIPRPDWVVTTGEYQNIDAISGLYDGGDADRDYLELNKLPTIGNAFFRKSVVEDNLFRKDLGPQDGKMGYGEDTEFFLRLKNKGEKILYIKDALTYHNIEANKFLKKYFLKREYEMGFFDVRYMQLPPHTVRYFGIPRYLFRKILKLVLLWSSSLDPHRRFFYKLRVYYTFGEIAGSAVISSRGRR